MKNATFTIHRNQVFELIRGLRLFVKNYDRNGEKDSEYQMIRNQEMVITLRIEKCNLPVKK